MQENNGFGDYLKKIDYGALIPCNKKKQNKGLGDMRASGWRRAVWYIFIGFINVPDAWTLQGSNNKGNSCKLPGLE